VFLFFGTDLLFPVWPGRIVASHFSPSVAVRCGFEGVAFSAILFSPFVAFCLIETHALSFVRVFVSSGSYVAMWFVVLFWGFGCSVF